MTTAHHDRIFQHAWAEHQQIRSLLAEIQGLIAESVETSREGPGEVARVSSSELRNRLSDLMDRLRRRFAFEGGNGEVEIALACDRSLDSEVSALAVRREKLGRVIDDLFEAFVSAEYASLSTARLQEALWQLLGDLAHYLSDKMDALRRSMLSNRERGLIKS